MVTHPQFPEHFFENQREDRDTERKKITRYLAQAATTSRYGVVLWELHRLLQKAFAMLLEATTAAWSDGSLMPNPPFFVKT